MTKITDRQNLSKPWLVFDKAGKVFYNVVSMKALDMKKVYRDYKGKWVALEGPGSNKVVAAGKNLKWVVKQAQKKGIEVPLVTQIPKKLLPIVGGPFTIIK